MNILCFTGYYLPGYKGGGPIKTIKNLFDQTGDEINFKLITSDRDLGDTSAYTSITSDSWNQVGNVSVLYTQSGISGKVQITKILLNRDYDIVYLNSFFSSRFSVFPLLIAKMLQQRIILGPRGEFSEGALSLKSFKKRFFISFYKLLRLHKGIIFQASSDYEANDIRRVLGNDTDIHIAEDIGAQEFAKQLNTRTASPLKVVFLSRITPMKNLLFALQTLKKIQQPLEYHIYGPIEDPDYWQQCEQMITSLPSHVHIEHKGTLMPSEVIKTLADYDVFFMPTKGENFSHVITEALCAGLPVLIADTTPWRNLQEFGIGWDLPLNNPNAFSSTLDELAAMPPEEHLAMRQNVLTWAKEKFSQRDAVEANIALFKYAYQKK